MISKKNIIIVAGIALLCSLPFFFKQAAQIPHPSIKIGILHSQTGTMAISEKDVIDATILAIEEINRDGGLLGKPLEYVIMDGASDWPTFAKHAETLIKNHEVAAIFGCWTSASRKTVKPIIERYNHLLFYPVQYEGLEKSPNIIYMGAAPNQQIIPGATWALQNLGKKFFLVGSDYVFPHAANKILKYHINALGGQVVGEEYLLLGNKDQHAIDSIVQQILQSNPDVIFNTINGDTNIAFFKALRQAGITPEKIPTISCSIAEPELAILDRESMIGDYAVWNYFQSVDNTENKQLIRSFFKRYGTHRKVSDPMQAAYIGVHLWAQAVKAAQSSNPQDVRPLLFKQSAASSQGAIYIDADTNHAWKRVRIGKIQEDGQFNLVWDSKKSVEPTPYPPYQNKEEWERFLKNLYQRWGNQWANTNS